MKLLCLDISHPAATPEQYAPHMRAEVRHAWDLYTAGFIRDISFRQDRPGVSIMAEADSVAAARAVLMTFPLAKAGLIDWDIIPLGPMANWALLFAET